jgi:hypothetical protein
VPGTGVGEVRFGQLGEQRVAEDLAQSGERT